MPEALSKPATAVSSPAALQPRRELLLILALACVIAFAFQGSRGLYETTEGRYAEAGREMLETGHWLIPELAHHPHLTKPPLTYWAIAGGMALLGQNEWGVRLYLAVAFVIMVWVVYRIGSLLWDSRTGLVACGLYACAPAAVYGLFSVSTDQPLALFELLMVLCYCHLWRGDRHVRAWRIGLWVCAGLGFMTKGPLPLLLLAALAAHSYYLRRRGLNPLRLFQGAGPWLGAAIGLSWFLLLLWRDPKLWSFFLGQEVYGRVFTDQHNRNPRWYGPFAVYLPVLVFGLGLPILAWVLPVKRLGLKTGLQQVLARPGAALLAAWILIPLVVLSISRSRLPLYVLPLFPAVVLATARVVTQWFHTARAGTWFRVYLVGMGIVIVAVKGIAGRLEVEADSRRLARVVSPILQPGTGCVIFESEGLYGLDFYLNGRAERVHKPAAESLSQTAVADLSQELSRLSGCRRVLFVTDGKRPTERLREALTELHLQVSDTRRLDRYFMLLVDLPPG